MIAIWTELVIAVGLAVAVMSLAWRAREMRDRRLCPCHCMPENCRNRKRF